MKTKNISGFTLLEMMTVLAIVSMLSAGGWHSWSGWQQRQQLNDSARQIQQLLIRIRSEANWHNATRLLWLKAGSHWCIGTGDIPPDRCRSAPHLLSNPYPHVRVSTFTEGTGFYGRRNVARPGRITIANGAGERRIIISARGRVRICAQSEEQCQ